MRSKTIKICIYVAFATLMFGCGNSQQRYEWIIEPTFMDVDNFSEGLAAVLVDNKWGFIDVNGNFAIEAKFDQVASFSEGMAFVSSEGTMLSGNGKWGFIDKTGKFIIEPKFTKNMGGSALGNRWFVKINLDDEKGYLDYKGNFTKEIPRLYNDTIRYSQNDIIPQSGMVDGKLKIVQVEPDYIFPPFSEGLAMAVREGKWGFVDKSGKWIIQPEYKSADNFSESFANVQEQTGNWKVIDREGKVVLTSYSHLSPFSEGLAVAAKTEKYKNYGYIDKMGNWIIQPQFEKAYNFTNGIALVKKKGKWGIIKLK